MHVLDVEKQFCLGRLTHCRIKIRTFQCAPRHILEERASVLVQESVTRLQDCVMDRLNWWLFRGAARLAQMQTVSRSQKWLGSQHVQLQWQDIWSVLNNVQCSFENMVFRDCSLQPFMTRSGVCQCCGVFALTKRTTLRTRRSVSKSLQYGLCEKHGSWSKQSAVHLFPLDPGTMTSSVTTPSGAQDFSRHLVQVIDVCLHGQFLHDPCPCNNII